MKCHYCREYPANTKDHIVPRAKLILQRHIPDWFRRFNKVPCCQKCNNAKGDKRSNCDCPQCEWAWKIAEVFFLKDSVIIHEEWKIPA